jgi:hypothetical protein
MTHVNVRIVAAVQPGVAVDRFAREIVRFLTAFPARSRQLNTNPLGRPSYFRSTSCYVRIRVMTILVLCRADYIHLSRRRTRRYEQTAGALGKHARLGWLYRHVHCAGDHAHLDRLGMRVRRASSDLSRMAPIHRRRLASITPYCVIWLLWLVRFMATWICLSHPSSGYLLLIPFTNNCHDRNYSCHDPGQKQRELQISSQPDSPDPCPGSRLYDWTSGVYDETLLNNRWSWIRGTHGRFSKVTIVALNGRNRLCCTIYATLASATPQQSVVVTREESVALLHKYLVPFTAS